MAEILALPRLLCPCGGLLDVVVLLLADDPTSLPLPLPLGRRTDSGASSSALELSSVVVLDSSEWLTEGLSLAEDSALLSPPRATIAGPFVSLRECDEARRNFVVDSADFCESNGASRPCSSLPRFFGVMGWGDPKIIIGRSTMVAVGVSFEVTVAKGGPFASGNVNAGVSASLGRAHCGERGVKAQLVK